MLITSMIRNRTTKEKEYRRNREIGRVYQNPAMGTCPSMTILENMALADNKGKMYGLSRGTNKARIEFYREELAKLDLGLEDNTIVSVSSIIRSAVFGSRAAVCSSRMRNLIGVMAHIRRAIAWR